MSTSGVESLSPETLAKSKFPDLFPAEIFVLLQVALGKSNKEVGIALNTSEGTVKVQMKDILKKMRVKNRVQAALTAADEGLPYFRGTSTPADTSGLSPRPREVLSGLAFGKTNKEIGKELKISEGTIKVHVKAILKTLRVRNRCEAALVAYRAGLPHFTQSLPTSENQVSSPERKTAFVPPLSTTDDGSTHGIHPRSWPLS